MTRPRLPGIDAPRFFLSLLPELYELNGQKPLSAFGFPAAISLPMSVHLCIIIGRYQSSAQGLPGRQLPFDRRRRQIRLVKDIDETEILLLTHFYADPCSNRLQ